MKLKILVQPLPLLASRQATHLGVTESHRTSYLMVDSLSLELPMRGRRRPRTKRISLKTSPCLTGRCCRRGKGPRTLRTKQTTQKVTRLLRKAHLLAEQNCEKMLRVRSAWGCRQTPSLCICRGFITWGPGAGASHTGAELLGEEKLCGCKQEVCRAPAIHDRTSGSKALIPMLR